MHVGKRWAALVLGAFGFLACETPEHPKNANAADEMCGPMCTREAQCNSSVDKNACLTKCKAGVTPRAVYFSEAFLADQRACVDRQTCGNDLVASIHACQKIGRTRFEPSAAATSFCEKKHARNVACGFAASDSAHCLYSAKLYSDAILGQLSDCLDDPCGHFGKCISAIVGPDNGNMTDDERQEFAMHGEIPVAPGSVALSGKTVVLNDSKTPVAGAQICVYGDASAPCATSAEDGAFALTLPGDKDVTLAIVGPKPEFGQILVGYPAHANDTSKLTIGVPRAALLAKRYAAAGATYPDLVNGSIVASAYNPKPGGADLGAITMTIDPKSGADARYLENAASDQVTKYRTGVFLGVTPGIVDVTFAGSTCAPSYGAIATDKPNTVRVVVAPGFETEVHQRCAAQ